MLFSIDSLGSLGCTLFRRLGAVGFGHVWVGPRYVLVVSRLCIGAHVFVVSLRVSRSCLGCVSVMF